MSNTRRAREFDETISPDAIAVSDRPAGRPRLSTTSQKMSAAERRRRNCERHAARRASNQIARQNERDRDRQEHAVRREDPSISQNERDRDRLDHATHRQQNIQNQMENYHNRSTVRHRQPSIGGGWSSYTEACMWHI